MENIIITDNTKILKAHPKYPDIMSDSSGDALIERFKELQSLYSSLQDKRKEVRELETKYEYLKHIFNIKAELFDIEYATKKIKVHETDNTQTGDVMNRHN